MFPRFFSAAAPFPAAVPARMVLDGEAQHHLVVRRLKVGDTLVLFDGEGREAEGTLQRLEKHRAEIALHDLRVVSRESPLATTLILSLIAQDAMDYAVQKSVELGVNRIVPLQAHYSQALPTAAWAGRHAHWQKIIIAACTQCGRNTLPTLMPMQRFADWQATLTSPAAQDWRCVADFDGQALRQLYAENYTEKPSGIHALTLAVGPEGGFSDEEIQQLVHKQFIPVRLGARVLRAETAAVNMLAQVQGLWGDG